MPKSSQRSHELLALLTLPALFIAKSTLALSFISFDTRSMALGNTGVAFAQPSKAPLFNPALLSTRRDTEGEKYSFSIHSGARLFDRDGFIDGVRQYQDNDAESAFQSALANFNNKVDLKLLTASDFDRLSATTDDLLSDVEGLSSRPLRIGGSVGGSFARTGRWGAAGFLHTYAVGGSIIDFADADRTLINETLRFGKATLGNINLIAPYADFVQKNSNELQAAYDAGGFEALEQELRGLLMMSNLADNAEPLVSLLRSYYEIYSAGAIEIEDIELLARLPNLEEEFQSELELQGSLITESGVSFSRRLSERHGLSLGATLKVLKFETIDYRARIVDATRENFNYRDHRATYSDPNIDLGLVGDLGDQVRWGIVLRNWIARDYETVRGNTIRLRPQARVGMVWQNTEFTVAADLDLTRNEPLGFDSDKQFLGLGMERRWLRWSGRCGLRYNLVDNSALLSLGTALHIGRTRFELSAAGAKDTVGVALQFDVGY